MAARTSARPASSNLHTSYVAQQRHFRRPHVGVARKRCPREAPPLLHPRPLHPRPDRRRWLPQPPGGQFLIRPVGPALSSESQAARCEQLAIHSLTSVVFPKPAGAEMRTSLRCRPALNCSIRRGRETNSGRTGGI